MKEALLWDEERIDHSRETERKFEFIIIKTPNITCNMSNGTKISNMRNSIHIPKVTLIMNSLNSATRRHRLIEWIKKHLSVVCNM